MSLRTSSLAGLMTLSVVAAAAAQAPAGKAANPQAEVAGMAGLTVLIGLPRWSEGLQAGVAQQARERLEQMAGNPHRAASPAAGRAAAEKAQPKVDAIIKGCFAEIETGMQGALAKTLAADERSALQEFGRSPTGQAILAKGARAFQDDSFISSLTPAETQALAALGKKQVAGGSLDRVLPEVRQKLDQTLRDSMKCMQPKVAQVMQDFEADLIKAK